MRKNKEQTSAPNRPQMGGSKLGMPVEDSRRPPTIQPPPPPATAGPGAVENGSVTENRQTDTLVEYLDGTVDPGISWGPKEQRGNGQAQLQRETTDGPDLFGMSSKGSAELAGLPPVFSAKRSALSIVVGCAPACNVKPTKRLHNTKTTWEDSVYNQALEWLAPAGCRAPVNQRPTPAGTFPCSDKVPIDPSVAPVTGSSLSGGNKQ
ncbi:hypothetical protein JOQ06_029287, partial [Pogonophryne albipinna]